MFENIKNIFKKNKKREMLKSSSKDTAKERLHLVLMQDRANVSADFLDLMRKEIIEVIKKYIDIDEKAMDVRLTTETNEEGVQGAPALYANIPIINIKDETRKLSKTNQKNKIQEEPPKVEELEKEKQEDKEVRENKEQEGEQLNHNEKPTKNVKEKQKEATNEQKNEVKESLNKNRENSNKEVSSKQTQVSSNEQSTDKPKKNKNDIKEEKKNEE